MSSMPKNCNWGLFYFFLGKFIILLSSSSSCPVFLTLKNSCLRFFLNNYLSLYCCSLLSKSCISNSYNFKMSFKLQLKQKRVFKNIFWLILCKGTRYHSNGMPRVLLLVALPAFSNMGYIYMNHLYATSKWIIHIQNQNACLAINQHNFYSPFVFIDDVLDLDTYIKKIFILFTFSRQNITPFVIY